jgi:hypothetical protein
MRILSAGRPFPNFLEKMIAEKDRLLLSEHLFKRIKLMSIPSGTDQIKEELSKASTG